MDTDNRMKAIDARRTLVKELAGSGKTVKEIAVELDATINVVHHDLDVLGLKKPKTAPGVLRRKAEARKIADAAIAGMNASQWQASDSIGIAARREAVRLLALRGLTRDEIVENLSGVSYGAVCADLQTLGIIAVSAASVRESAYLRLHADGMSAGEIARDFDVSVDQILKIMRGEKSGIATKASASPEERAQRRKEVGKLFDEGHDVTAISDVLGVSRGVVYSDLDYIDRGDKPVQTIRKEDMAARADNLRAMIEQGRKLPDLLKESGLTRTQITRIAKTYDIKIPLKGPTHGLRSTYESGCRCDPCRLSNIEHQRQYRQRNKEAMTPENAHGTLKGYRAWSCRCDECKIVWSEYQRENNASLTPPPRKNEIWTAEEDYLVMNKSLSAREVATKLQRTFYSVNGRRGILRRKGVDYY